MARSLAPIAIALLAAPACGQLLFSDNFDAGASPLWVNERGPWTTSGGVYYCTAPSNSPPTISSLPYVLGDLELEVDVVGVVDGGTACRVLPMARVFGVSGCAIAVR